MTKDRDSRLPDGEKLAGYLDKRLRKGTLDNFTVQDFYQNIVNSPEEFAVWKWAWCHDFINSCFKKASGKDLKRKAKKLLEKFEKIKSDPPEGEFNLRREIIGKVTLDDLLKSFDHDFALGWRLDAIL